jgi:hypothetical protein
MSEPMPPEVDVPDAHDGVSQDPLEVSKDDVDG